MMPRYVDADALMKKLNEDPIGQTIVQRYNIDGFIEAFPTADVQEVKHGRWVKQFDENCWWTECSECGNYPLKSAYGDEQLSDFCPYCGADMRKETEDATN